MPTDGERFNAMLATRRTCLTVPTFEEDYALGLVRTAAIELQRPLWLWSMDIGARDGLVSGAKPAPQTEDPTAGLAWLADRDTQALVVTLDLAGHLRSERPLRAWRRLVARYYQSGAQLIMIDHTEELPDVVRAYATRFDVSLPGEIEIEEMVKAVLRRARTSVSIQINISRSAWRALLRNLRGLTRRQIEQIVSELVAEDHMLCEEDLHHVLTSKRQMLQSGGLLEYIEAPADLDDIGGLRRLKRWLAVRQQTLATPEETSLPAPRGILMLGVQGAGKSLCAKAVAAAWHRPLLRMDVGALYDRYVGESERRLRLALQQAEAMAPVILWIDEIEKAFASAASQSTDGGLSKRMFGTLLTWMQEHRQPVFLIATANDIEALPPELLRKGRFDEIFFVDLPDDQTRADIFTIHLRKRDLDPAAFDLEALSRAATGYSGAEIEQVIVSALYAAAGERRPLDDAALLAALRESPPLSVTMHERVAALRVWAAGRCVPAD